MKVQITLLEDEVKAAVVKEISKRGYALSSNQLRFGTTKLGALGAAVYLTEGTEIVAIADIDVKE